MAIKKKKNKFTVPQEYNQSVIFARGGNLYEPTLQTPGQSSFLKTGQPMQFGSIQTPAWNTQINGQGIGQVSSTGTQSAMSKAQTSAHGVSAYLGAAQGAVELGAQMFNNFDTSGIGKEVQSTNDMSRADIQNQMVSVDSNKSNVAGQSLSGTLTGAKAGMGFGPAGAAIGAGIGLVGGLASSIFGNQAKQRKADEAAKQWTNNLEAKDRQFNQQDLRANMANFNANGGDLFAYGGNIQSNSPLTEFNTGGRHEDNIQGGIMQGTGANGQPNLVEQGETKHEDYIFSDRLKINPKISGEFKLPKGLNGKTFADASKYLSREGKDRPNDPISNKAIKAHLAKLTAAQEGLKEQMQPQGIPMDGQQPNIMGVGQQFANGGKFEPAENGKFWGYENGKYTPEYTKDVDDIISKDWATAKKYMTDNNITYAQTPEKFRAAAFDKKVGDVHKYIQSRRAKEHGETMTYTHTTDRNFYDSGQFSPEEKALYDPETLTRQITKEEYDKAMKTNDPSDNYIGPGYRSTRNTFAFGGDQTHYNNPTHQGANVFSGIKPHSSQLTKDNRFAGMQQLGVPMNGLTVDPVKTPQTFDMNTFSRLNQKQFTQGDASADYSRYAPVAANIITGIGDMFEKPEEVKYGRVNPEMITSRMDYQPVDTEWMNNKMNATYAGTRDQMINQAGGNRAAAMAGLTGINQQQQNAIGEAYLKAQDINYGRKQQANQFNASIEAQNVAARNAAQQANLQLQMQEMDMNARNRAAKRNAARQAILNAASNLGDIGRENFNANTVKSSTGYGYNPDGTLKYYK